MKKLLLTILVFGILITMSNCSTDESDNIFTLSFVSDSHDSGTVPDSISFKSGDTIAIPESDLLKNGYSLRWQKGDNIYKEGDELTLSGDTVLTAEWAEKKYKVIYGGDDKSNWWEEITDNNMYATGDMVQVIFRPKVMWYTVLGTTDVILPLKGLPERFGLVFHQGSTLYIMDSDVTLIPIYLGANLF